MAWIAVAATVAGTALNMSAQSKASKAANKAASRQQQAAEVEAAHMDQQATLSVAAAQRQMLEERRQARLVESRALAVAAASGAGASDTTVVNIISNIAAEGAHRSAIALYEGKERERQLRIGAQIRREGGDLQAEYGKQASKAAQIGSIGTLFSGAGSLYARYGQSTKTTANSGSDLSGGTELDT